MNLTPTAKVKTSKQQTLKLLTFFDVSLISVGKNFRTAPYYIMHSVLE